MRHKMETSVLKQSDANENIRHNKISTRYEFVTLVIVFISLIVTVILVSLDGIIVYIIYKDVTYNLPLISTTRMEEFEFFCDDISLSPDEDEETFRPGTGRLDVSVNSEGKYVCKSKNLGELANKVIDRKLRLRLAEGKEEDPYLSCGNRSLTPKSGDFTTTFSKISRNKLFDNGTETVLQWEHQNKTGNSSGDQINTHSNAEITVQTGQTYVVYASVHVNISRQNTKNLENKFTRRTFTLKVCKKRHGYEQTVLGETKRFASDLEADVVSSVKVMGHLHLSKNDSVYVKVSNADYVIHISKGNTFGIFPI